MRELILTPNFKKVCHKFTQHHAKRQKRIEKTLEQMRIDVFANYLDTHKRSGKLFGLLACSCGYNCRIVFQIYQEPTTGKEFIVLLDIGTHDEVY